MVDWNNFHAYMPRGYYRQTEPINYLENDPESAKLVAEIDKYLSESGFDVETYEKVRNITDTYFSRGLDCANKRDREGIKHNLSRADKFSKMREELMKPVIEHVKSLGFS